MSEPNFQNKGVLGVTPLVTYSNIVADIVIDENGYWKNEQYGIRLHTTRERKIQLLPETRDMLETIAGRDGDIDFGTEFDSRVITLQCYSENNLEKSELLELREAIRSFLNPKNSTKTLIFLEEYNKVYTVKLTGMLEVEQYPTWLRFTISLKATNPAMYQYTDNILTSNGTITNVGNEPTGINIEFDEGLVKPYIIIDGNILAYNETTDSKIYVDTELMIAYKIVNNKKINVMQHIVGKFIKAKSGDSILELSDQTGKIIVKYKSKWI